MGYWPALEVHTARLPRIIAAGLARLTSKPVAGSPPAAVRCRQAGKPTSASLSSAPNLPYLRGAQRCKSGQAEQRLHFLLAHAACRVGL